MKKGNPFTLTFGKKPAEYISRYENTETIISTFDADHAVSQTYLIEGVRGSGKTVLMTSVSKELEDRGDWIIVDLIVSDNLLDGLAVQLAEACKSIKNLLPSSLSISVAGISVGMSSDKSSQESIVIVDKLFKALQKKGKKVLITIDEVISGQNMREFASEFQILVRRDYPIFMIMTGLYENIYSIQNDPSLTFLLRAPKIILEPLSIYQISVQYETVFGIDSDEATHIARITKGYAFAFQALGSLYYDKKDDETLDDILPKFDAMLDDFVYKKIWSSLSDKDKMVAKAIPDHKTQVKDVCTSLNMSNSIFSKYKERLTNKGVLYSPQYGYVELALPRFDKIISRYE